MFGFIKDKLTKIYTNFSSKVANIFSKSSLDQESLNELESLLISADVGIKTTREIIEKLNIEFKKGNIQKGQDLKKALEELLIQLISKESNLDAQVFLLVGINGSGKTSFAAKLANLYKKQGKKVLLVAADTFRAAAVEQLNEWAKKIEVAIESSEAKDPSAVIYAGCEKFKKENFDILIIDTAGRLQTKVNLMKELEKIRKVIAKQLPNNKVCTLLTVDAMLGQNSFEQAKLFNEATTVNNLVLTKMDGTAKAGIVFAISQELNIPVGFISFGEKIENIKEFNPVEYVEQLLSE